MICDLSRVDDLIIVLSSSAWLKKYSYVNSKSNLFYVTNKDEFVKSRTSPPLAGGGHN